MTVFYKGWKVSGLAEQLLTSQEWFCSTELPVGYMAVSTEPQSPNST